MTENSTPPQPSRPQPSRPEKPSATPPASQGGPLRDGEQASYESVVASRRYEESQQAEKSTAGPGAFTPRTGAGSAKPAAKGPVTAQSAAANVLRENAQKDSAEHAERYGKKRGGMSLPRKIGLGIVGLLILGGVAGYIGWENANPPIQGTVLNYQQSSDNAINVTFEVDKSAGSTATCTLQALDNAADVVGSVDVQVPAGRAKNVMTATLETTATPTTVEVSSCSIT